MLRPLADRIAVKPLDPPPLSSIIEIVHVGPKNASRGEVIAVGPKAHDTKVGDIVRFTDVMKFPLILDHGERRVIIQEADVMGVEEPGSYEIRVEQEISARLTA